MIEVLILIIGYVLWIWRKKAPENSSCDLSEPIINKVQSEPGVTTNAIYPQEEVDNLLLILTERDDNDCC